MFGHDRQELRAIYVNAWKKYSEKKILTQLEIQIVEIIKNHPEYHKAIKENDIKIDYTPELGKTNPFLHMSLHIALREQISTNFNNQHQKWHSRHSSQAIRHVVSLWCLRAINFVVFF